MRLLLNILGAVVIVSPLAAQDPSRTVFIEGRGGAVVPTFDIADVAKTGATFSKKSELTTTNAWVWPVTAGLRVRF